MNRLFSVLLALGAASSSEAAFSRRKPIVIDNTKVMGAGDLANFPVLVSVVDANLQASVASPQGYDILFRAEDDATCGGPGLSPCVLDHEIETWNPSTGGLVAWVRVPVLSTSVNTTIYIYYGDPAITCPQERPRNVWDAGFREVFHMDQPGDQTDSTGNGYTAAPRGTVGLTSSGRLGPATEFFGPGESRLNISDGILPANSAFTIEGWFRLASLQGPAYVGLYTKGRDDPGPVNFDWVGLFVNDFNQLIFGWYQGGNLAGGPSPLLINTWYHAAATYDPAGANRVLYLNGVAVASDSGAAGYTEDIPQYTRAGTDSNGNYLDGFLDELRFSSVVRTAGWIETTYNNANSPVTFYASYGPEDVAPPPLSGSCPAVQAPCQGIGSGTCHLRSIGSAANYTTGTVSATSGSALVTGAGTAWVTANRGRGDRITIDGTDYTVLAVDGEAQLRLTSPFTGTTGSGKAYTIARKFSLPSQWEDCIDGPGGAGCEGVSSSSLVADNRGEIGIVYDDGGFYGGSPIVLVNGSITDATHTITLTVDPGNRHTGVGGTGVEFNNTGLNPAIRVEDDHVTVEWLNIAGGAGGAASAFLVQNLALEANHVVVRNNLIHDLPGNAIRIADDDAIVDFTNNLVWAVAGNQVRVTLQPVRGSRLRFFSNTFYTTTGTGIAFLTTTETPWFTFSNNIIYDTSAGFNVPWLNAASRNNLSDDPAPPSGNFIPDTGHSPGGGGLYAVPVGSVLFTDTTPGSENLHIQAGSAAASMGFDASALFVNDIDDQVRQSPWDIGADDLTATVNFRSIGTAPNYVTGTVSATNGATTVTGSGTLWVTANRGRGDRILIDGVNYVVQSVDSETSLTLATTFAGATGSGKGYTLARQFTTMQAWEDCVDGGPCAFFPVASSSLVADNRREVGIVYNDSTFALGADVIIDGSVTDASHNIVLTADPGNRHLGVIGGGVVVDGQNALNEIIVSDPFVGVEWLEIMRVRGGSANSSVRVLDAGAGVLLQNLLIHDYYDAGGNTMSGIRLSGGGNQEVTIRNTMIFDGDVWGIQGDEPSDTLTIENCSIDNIRDAGGRGLDPTGSLFIVRNTIVTRSAGSDFGGTVYSPLSSHNISSDGTAQGSLPVLFEPAANLFAIPGTDLRLKAGANVAVDSATDLSASFWNDIEQQSRLGLTWDRGADERGAPTAVTLVSFETRALDGAVELAWETASEIQNLGFHVYRAPALSGPFERITARLIPGLGSSPSGAKYRYVDSGLENGRMYHYELEDVATTGRITRHGPLAASPSAGAGAGVTAPTITFGEGSEGVLRVRDVPGGVEIELRTPGFFAEPLPDGTVRVTVPGLDGAPLPVSRPYVPISGRTARIVSVEELETERIVGLIPSGASSEVVAARGGVVRLRSRSQRSSQAAAQPSARILGVAYQASQRKAQLELAPLRVDPETGELVLARRLVVRLAFVGREPKREARSRVRARTIHSELVTKEPGLYAIAFDRMFSRGRSVPISSLSLTRLGEAVPFAVEPDTGSFGPGSRLLFWSDGEKANSYGREAVYRLEGGSGTRLSLAKRAAAEGALYRYRLEREENHYYQAALLEAPDPWLWDLLMAPQGKSFPFTVDSLAPSAGAARIEIYLQGTSDFPTAEDHRVRALVNGAYLGETSWDGKNARELALEIPPGVLAEGPNSLELESVQSDAPYSMVMLDRFTVTYDRLPPGEAHYVVGDAVVAESAVLAAETRPAGARPLTPSRGAELLAVGPREFLPAAAPLLDLRRRQGLAVRAVAIEDVYAAYGYGEARPEALRAFLRAAYQDWPEPRVRYFLLLGDATYDFKDYLGTGVANRIPPWMTKTSYLLTASDPAYAAVNGEDLLPDVALGRLPAANASEMKAMVDKILRYEAESFPIDAGIVLVADNPDDAGDFERDAREIAEGVLAGRRVETLFLRELGASALRERLTDRLDEGASLASYLGHGGIHLWASENVFDTTDVASLSPQGRQPILLTLNCLNGYFHFPYFDSLGEAMVKAEGRGAIAAFSPSGLSLDAPAHRFHQALMRALLDRSNRRLGDAVLKAQEEYASTGTFPELLAIYQLLGDPSLRLRN